MYQLVSTFKILQNHSDYDFLINYLKSTCQIIDAHVQYDEHSDYFGLWKNDTSMEKLEKNATLLNLIGRHIKVDTIGSVKEIPSA